MARSETSQRGQTSDEVVGILKKKLNFSAWPLTERELIAGFSPQEQQTGVLADYRLEREILLTSMTSCVTRRYSYRKIDSPLALALTVIVGQAGARDAAEELVAMIAASQMRREPRVDFQGIGDVVVYPQPTSDQSIAFVRKNIAINIEGYARFDQKLPIRELAQQIDGQLTQRETSEDLADQERTPKILRFEPETSSVKAGGRTDLVIDLQDNYPPHELLFEALNGSYNRDPAEPDLWYFRAGHQRGSAQVILTVVNSINLLAKASARIEIGST